VHALSPGVGCAQEHANRNEAGRQKHSSRHRPYHDSAQITAAWCAALGRSFDEGALNAAAKKAQARRRAAEAEQTCGEFNFFQKTGNTEPL
jgi:hypothetical protein